MRVKKPVLTDAAERQGLRLADRLFLIGIGLRIFVSNPLLSSFTNYTSQGGSVVEKFHPGTYLVFLAVILRLSNRMRFAMPKAVFEASAWFLICIGTLAYFQMIRFGIGSLAYLVETFLIAVIAGLFIANASRVLAEACLKLLVLAVAINAVLAILEYITRSHLLPFTGMEFTYFRSYSLFGHPLNNALITGFVSVFVLRNRLAGNWSFAYFVLCIVALMTFGGRSALAVSVGAALLETVWILVLGVWRGKAKFSALALIPLGAVVALSAAVYALLETPLGERFRGMSDLSDNSFAARLNVLSIYDMMTWNERLWGISASLKSALIDQNPYFNTIENFWIDMSISFGLVPFVVFACFFLWFVFATCWRTGRSTLSALAVFLIVASSNNALSIKTPVFLIFIIMIIAYGAQRRRVSDEVETCPSLNRLGVRNAP